MWWFWWYIGTILWAFIYLLGGPIGPRLYYGECIAAAIAIGTVMSTWIVYVSSILVGSLSLTSVLLATFIMYLTIRNRISSFIAEYRAMRDRGIRRDDIFAFVVVLSFAVWLWPTYSGRMIPTRDGNILSGGSCYGDLPIHMTIAESFLVGCNTKVNWGSFMESPIFSAHAMTYPFLPDFHAAILVRLGSSMRDGFLHPGFFMASSLWALLYYFTLRVTQSRLGSILSVYLVACAGGTGGLRYILQDLQKDPETFNSQTLLTHTMHDWYQSFERSIYHDVVQHDPTGEWKYLWFAFIPHIMLPQRGANFAYPVAVLVLSFVWMATDANISLHQGHRRTLLVSAAVLAASLPMVQAHSFIGLGLIIGVIALCDIHKWLADSHLFMSWVYAGIAAIVFAYPQMAQFTDTVSSGFKGKFLQYGWLFNNYEFGEPHNSVLGLLNFWYHNLGPAVYLFLFAILASTLEIISAYRLTRKLSQTGDRATEFGKYLATTISNMGESIGEPNPLPPAPKSATGSVRPLPTMVFPFIRSMNLDLLDSYFAPLNAFSPTKRALDTVKLALGGLLVFLVSNYINFQPWDRDNAKIYYVFLFVAAPLNGALLAAPFEYFASSWNSAPGRYRIPRWFGATSDLAASDNKSSDSSGSLRRILQTVFTHLYRFVVIPLFILCTLSGTMMLIQEYRDSQHGGGILLDHDAINMARYIRSKVHPQSVVMHSNYHVQPSGALAGRPSLVAYYGWVSNHGYNADERLGDRDFVMENALMDSNTQAYALLRKWGVKYVLGENMRIHSRNNPSLDENTYLDGNLVRVHRAGRYELLEVKGY